MKSEHRRGLSENYLAKWLTSFLESITPFKNHIYWTVIGILAVICIGFIWSNVSHSGRAKAWGEYFAASESSNLEDLEALVPTYSSGEAAAKIRLTVGETLLFEACNEIHTQKDKAREKLEKALGFFLDAQPKCRSDSLLNEQVLYDLGKTYESLAMVRTGQDDLTSAINTYQQLVSRYAQGIFTKEVEKKLQSIESPMVSRLMNYHAAYTPNSPAELVPSQIDPTIPSQENPILMPEGFDLPENLNQTLEFPADLGLDR